MQLLLVPVALGFPASLVRHMVQHLTSGTCAAARWHHEMLFALIAPSQAGCEQRYSLQRGVGEQSVSLALTDEYGLRNTRLYRAALQSGDDRDLDQGLDQAENFSCLIRRRSVNGADAYGRMCRAVARDMLQGRAVGDSF